jgi:predicted lipoprotein with Yx(FWY)xxD motif
MGEMMAAVVTACGGVVLKHGGLGCYSFDSDLSVVAAVLFCLSKWPFLTLDALRAHTPGFLAYRALQ